MGKFLRAVLVVLLLVMLICFAAVLSFFITVPQLSAQLADWVEQYRWVGTALGGFIVAMMALCLVFLAAALLYPSKNEVYVLVREVGSLEISRRSIESAAELAMSKPESVRRCTARVKGRPRPGRLRLVLYAELATTAELTATGDEIQKLVGEELARSLGIAPNSIEVYLTTRHADDRTAARRHKHSPRVI